MIYLEHIGANVLATRDLAEILPMHIVVSEYGGRLVNHSDFEKEMLRLRRLRSRRRLIQKRGSTEA